jgi:hypothetical protein
MPLFSFFFWLFYIYFLFFWVAQSV